MEDALKVTRLDFEYDVTNIKNGLAALDLIQDAVRGARCLEDEDIARALYHTIEPMRKAIYRISERLDLDD